MTIPREGERMKYQQDGKVFKITKITSAFVVLRALDDATQILTSPSGLDFFFDRLPPADSRGEQTLRKVDQRVIFGKEKNRSNSLSRL